MREPLKGMEQLEQMEAAEVLEYFPEGQARHDPLSSLAFSMGQVGHILLASGSAKKPEEQRKQRCCDTRAYPGRQAQLNCELFKSIAMSGVQETHEPLSMLYPASQRQVVRVESDREFEGHGRHVLLLVCSSWKKPSGQATHPELP